MRIGLDAGIPQLPDPQQPGKSGSQAAGGTSDQAAASTKLSWDETRVQSLSAAVAELPEIRQERVAALAQSMRSGTYVVTAEQTAEALMAQMNEAA
jgi:flagellar biosynthesis anti-sigma factor FlgM